MGLSDEQLKFLEDFILHRHLGHLKANKDSSDEEDQIVRFRQRHDLLQKLTDVPPLSEGRPAEQQTAKELTAKIRTLLDAEVPPHSALETAEISLKTLTDHVEDVQKDIAFVRRPRFEKGQALIAVLTGITMDFPAQCPEDDKQVLVKEHGKLTGMLKDKNDWTNISSWDEEDLISIDDDLVRLAFDVKKLHQRVEQAVKALETARAAATKAMIPSGGVGFSVAQSTQMAEMYRVASQEADQNVLGAEGSIRALEKLAKHAASTAHIRTRVSNRIAALPQNAPAGATKDQKAEWVRLRKDALAAVDEVLAT